VPAVARFLPDCVPDDLDALTALPVLVPVVVPVAVPVDRFTSALAPARALAELSRDPCAVLPAPATREDVADRLERAAGSTLPNVPFAFL
jgi:hypothetical protein